MNYIETVEIIGLWGNKKVILNFNENENFIIGVNGSGKTTIINLIAATMTADFSTIDRIQFEEITLRLRSKNDKRKKPFIQIIKEEDANTLFSRLLFRIQLSKKEKPFEIYLDDLEEERMYRHTNAELRYKFGVSGGHIKDRKDLQYQLDTLFNLSWLSIHRYRKNNINRLEDRTHESLVDQKIKEFSNNLLKYLSQLNRKSADETNRFQKFIFLSLLSSDSKEQLYQELKSIDLEIEKKALKQVYSLFDLEEKEYKNQLEKYFKSFVKSKDNWEKGSITIKDAEYLIGIRRIHSVVQQWNNLVDKQDEIYLYRDNFLKVINRLLNRKKLIINDKNELSVLTQNDKVISLMSLSSGEKQLLILLGETLLQQSEQHIYIADEPELSLHVDWQEKLVDSLKLLNPNCQIIFATHSPDIVSHYSKSVINIEERINEIV